MGVITDFNISANYHVEHPSLIGNTEDSTLNNSLRVDGVSSPYESAQLSASSQAHDGDSLNPFSRIGDGDSFYRPYDPLTPDAHDVSLFQIFFGRVDSNQKGPPETIWLYAMKQIKSFTIIGAVLIIVLSMISLVKKDYPLGGFFLLNGAVLIICCIYGNRHRDWRLLFGVLIISLTLAAYWAAEALLSVIATIDKYMMTDEDLATLGYSRRSLLIGYGALDCIPRLLGSFCWSLTSHVHEKVVKLLRIESVRIWSRSNPQHLSIVRVAKAQAAASAADNAPFIDRDLTRAVTFNETDDASRYSPPAVAENVEYEQE